MHVCSPHLQALQAGGGADLDGRNHDQSSVAVRVYTGTARGQYGEGLH